MKVLFLPGASPETSHLASGLFNTIPAVTVELTVVEYQFWGNKSQPDLNRELAHLQEECYDLILAKSAGCLLFLEAAARSVFSFKKAILLGAPLHLATQVGIGTDATRHLADQRVCLIHQQNDRVCPASELKRFNIYKLHLIPGSDHLYTNYRQYAGLVQKHLQI